VQRRQTYTPTLVLSEGRNAGPYDGYLAQLREERRQAAVEARRKGRDALAAETESRRRVGITWSPF
jgi:hypothetical protein